MESTISRHATGLEPMVLGGGAAATRTISAPALRRTTRRRSNAGVVTPAGGGGAARSRRRPKASEPEAETFVVPPTQQDIRARAYEIYLDRCGSGGDAMGDWLQAERELTEAYERALRAAQERRRS